MRLPDEIGVVVNGAIRGWVLDECAENGVVEFETRVIVDLDLDPERLRACLDNANRLRMTIVGDEERFSIRCNRVAKRHRFGGGRGFIQQRRVRDIASQVRDHLLEIEQRRAGLVRFLPDKACKRCTSPDFRNVLPTAA